MLTSIIIFILVLSVLVLVHELGHFLIAKRAGILVEEFGFGIPPRVFGKKIGETIWSINLLPFGGFVRLHGENTDQGLSKPKRAFLNKSKKVRIAVVVAGVVMNFILAVVSFSIVYSFSGIPKDTGQVRVLDISPDSPAQESGILVGDVIKNIGDSQITSTQQFIGLVETKLDVKTKITVSRTTNGILDDVDLNITPRKDHPQDQGPLGVVISTIEIYYPPIWQRPFVGIVYGFKDAIFWGKTIIGGLTTMIMGLFGGEVPKDVAGPVGIFALTSEAAKVGILTLINFVGILSVNLAILNILPFPALDGGRLLFIGVETIFGRRVLPKIESIVHAVGMLILIFLLLAITAGDIRRLIINGGLSGFLESFTK